VRRFLSYLADQGVVARRSNNLQPQRAAFIPSQIEFVHWMRQHRGVSAQTIDRHIRTLAVLLPVLGSNVSQYDAAAIRRAICAQAQRYCAATARTFANALRVYLRFLAAHGQCRPGLDQAVPLIPQWRLSALPKYLPAKDIERVIASCDLRKPVGIRDRAILLLLARLALRAGDIINLRLCDIDWHEGTLRVCGKGRRQVELPLPQDAGEAVLAYLDEARPQAATDQVFLCISAPVRPLQTAATISDIVRFALLRAGIADPPTRGANLLRHSAATSMLRAGATLDAIASILRHRSSDTTAHYAKVDVPMLGQLVQPWPEGTPC
jgi:site-specific recombinase XerD